MTKFKVTINQRVRYQDETHELGAVLEVDETVRAELEVHEAYDHIEEIVEKKPRTAKAKIIDESGE